MRDNFPSALNMLLGHEGGYSNHPDDPGGVTKYGVTHISWSKWIGRPATAEDIQALTIDDIRPLYKAWYWDEVRGDEVPGGVDFALFDFAVNSGVARAVKCVQKLVGETQDGVLGPKTLVAIQSADVSNLIDDICAARPTFLQNLSSFRVFGKGWSRRVRAVALQAKGLM